MIKSWLCLLFGLFILFAITGCADKDAITRMQMELSQKRQELTQMEQERRNVAMELSQLESGLKQYTDSRDKIKQEFADFYTQNPNIERVIKCAMRQIDPTMSILKAMITNDASHMLDGIMCGTMTIFGGERLEEVRNKISSMKDKFESVDSKVNELTAAFEEKRAKKAILDDNTTTDRLKAEISMLETNIACEESFWCRIKR